MATASSSKPLARPRQEAVVPPLENGDRLTRSEFERRYGAMPELKKSELIEGTVLIPSPVRFSSHAEPHLRLVRWLGTYQEATPGTRCSDNATVRLDLDNQPQPDALLLIDPALGGQARISEDDFVEGPPEFIAEVASSSVSYDLHSKLHVYRRNGVREYLVWRTLDQAIDWFVLREGQYEPLAPDGTVLKSEVFSGLWLDPEALLSGKLEAVLEILRQGLASADYAAFRARLVPERA